MNNQIHIKILSNECVIYQVSIMLSWFSLIEEHIGEYQLHELSLVDKLRKCRHASIAILECNNQSHIYVLHLVLSNKVHKFGMNHQGL